MLSYQNNDSQTRVTGMVLESLRVRTNLLPHPPNRSDPLFRTIVCLIPQGQGSGKKQWNKVCTQIHSNIRLFARTFSLKIIMVETGGKSV